MESWYEDLIARSNF